MSDDSGAKTEVALTGGPADGRTVLISPGIIEVRFGGPECAYRPTDDRNVWRYVNPTDATSEPVLGATVNGESA